MFKKLLFALGLAKAPAPVRTYFAASTFGAVPALAFVAWRHRDQLRRLFARGAARHAAPSAAPAA